MSCEIMKPRLDARQYEVVEVWFSAPSWGGAIHSHARAFQGWHLDLQCRAGSRMSVELKASSIGLIKVLILLRSYSVLALLWKLA
jgi:hypothetical protein